MNIHRCIFKRSSAQRDKRVHVYLQVGPLWIAASEQYAYQTNFWQVTRVSKMSSNGKTKSVIKRIEAFSLIQRDHILFFLIFLTRAIGVVQFYEKALMYYKKKTVWKRVSDFISNISITCICCFIMSRPSPIMLHKYQLKSTCMIFLHYNFHHQCRFFTRL